MSDQLSGSRAYWDTKACEDAFFFVDDREPYRSADEQRFWSRGESDLDLVLGQLGVAIAAGDRVADIGCGIGRLTRVLASRARRVYALDVSAEMLERARAHHPGLENVEWIHSDGVSLRPLADASIDACVSHVVFQHIPDPQITLGYVGEMGRVLTPGGWAAFQISNDPSVHKRRWDAAEIRRRLATLTGRAPRGQAHAAWRGSAVDLNDLATAAHGSGLELERVEGRGTQFCLVLARRLGRKDSARPTL